MKPIKLIIITIALFGLLIGCNSNIRLEGYYDKFGGAIEFNPQKTKDNQRPTFKTEKGEDAYLYTKSELGKLWGIVKNKVKDEVKEVVGISTVTGQKDPIVDIFDKLLKEKK